MVALALFQTLALDSPQDSDRMGYRDKGASVKVESPAAGDVVRLLTFPCIAVQCWEADLT